MDFDFSDWLVNLIDEGVDVVICSGELVDFCLIVRKLGGFCFVFCVSLIYLVEYGVFGLLVELVVYKCIFFCFFVMGLI